MSDPDERLQAIARCARRADLDENGGDRAETIDTILWYATDGAEGRDWGCGYVDV
jgi:hypothetical protein